MPDSSDLSEVEAELRRGIGSAHRDIGGLKYEVSKLQRSLFLVGLSLILLLVLIGIRTWGEARVA